MAKLKVLDKNRTLMSAIGLYPNRLTELTNEFFESFSNYFILFNVIFIIISCAVFLLNNGSDFGAALKAFLCIITGIQCGGMFLSIGLNMIKVKTLHLKLQEIVDDVYSSSVFSYKYFYTFFDPIYTS